MPRKTCPGWAGSAPPGGFNEAAARCRGKPRFIDGRVCILTPGFNEAAARCRGKHAPGQAVRLVEHASMRPRPDAAENCKPPACFCVVSKLQ